MELSNSYTAKKKRQLEIFKAYAKPLTSVKQRLCESYPQAVGEGRIAGEKVLRFNDFIELISNSRSFYSKFTDHCFNLNQIPNNLFGCIFFAIDENNKGYLNLNDWFHFNNILEYENYHFIILFEFFRKFDVAKGVPSGGSAAKSVNYGNKFLSFDELYLNVNAFKDTLKLLHGCIRDPFIIENKLFLDWDQFKWLRWYQFYPHGSIAHGPYITLNSLITILQNDIKEEKLHLGFYGLSQLNHSTGSMAISKNQLIYLMKLFYSHRIPLDVFNSLNFPTSTGIKSNNNFISYNVFRDLFYLFQNFDLLNQVVCSYAQAHGFSDREIRERFITRRDLLSFLNMEYNKVNNIVEFSPSQISLLFSMVRNSKKLNRLVQNHNQSSSISFHHRDSVIESFIQNEYINCLPSADDPSEYLEKFNEDYQNMFDVADEGKIHDDAPLSLLQSLRDWVPFFRKDVTHLPSSPSDDNELLTLEDIMKIVNPNYLNDLVHRMEVKRIESEVRHSNLFFFPIFDSIYNFVLGSFAGCIGATVVYPIDMVKTRMQAQRALSKYRNSIHCLIKTVSNDGIRGLYSGLGPQLIGVAPEKAIKLTVNDFMRGKLTDRNGNLSLYREIMSGATAGACQVVFTNPLEIIKIRLQVKSEYVRDVGKMDLNSIAIIRQLGFLGLYKGAAACLLRDIPFSAIYFPTYAHLKKDLFGYDPKVSDPINKISTWNLLIAGGLAGIPAAFLTTPFDVVKTRLQIDPKKGETNYSGVWDALRSIFKEEGVKSFFKGGPARVLRSSPQFGFTLAAYEIFHSLFPKPLQESSVSKASGSNGSITAPIGSVLPKLFPESSDGSSSNCTLYGPTIDHYSSSFLNYYYKSCQIGKVFMDLDHNFAKFDFATYQKFHNELYRSSNEPVS